MNVLLVREKVMWAPIFWFSFTNRIPTFPLLLLFPSSPKCQRMLLSPFLPSSPADSLSPQPIIHGLLYWPVCSVLLDYSYRTQTSGQWFPVTLSPCSEPPSSHFPAGVPGLPLPAGGQEGGVDNWAYMLRSEFLIIFKFWRIMSLCWGHSFYTVLSLPLFVFLHCFGGNIWRRDCKTQPLSSAMRSLYFLFPEA